MHYTVHVHTKRNIIEFSKKKEKTLWQRIFWQSKLSNVSKLYVSMKNMMTLNAIIDNYKEKTCKLNLKILCVYI